MFEALARAVTSVAGPLLVVFDDLQWCDVETLEFLHFLLRFGRTSRLLVVGTARDEEVGSEHPLTSLVGGLRASTRWSSCDSVGWTRRRPGPWLKG